VEEPVGLIVDYTNCVQCGAMWPRADLTPPEAAWGRWWAAVPV